MNQKKTVFLFIFQKQDIFRSNLKNCFPQLVCNLLEIILLKFKNDCPIDRDMFLLK